LISLAQECWCPAQPGDHEADVFQFLAKIKKEFSLYVSRNRALQASSPASVALSELRQIPSDWPQRCGYSHRHESNNGENHRTRLASHRLAQPRARVEWIGSNGARETSRPGMVPLAKSVKAAMVVRPGAVISVA